MENKGVEFSLQASLLRTRNFEWIVGGNIAKSTAKLKALGGEKQVILDGNYNGMQLVNRVGSLLTNSMVIKLMEFSRLRLRLMKQLLSIVQVEAIVLVMSVLLIRTVIIELMIKTVYCWAVHLLTISEVSILN